MQKISNCLMFNTEAEEAMNYYLSLFGDGKVLEVVRHGDAGPGPKGSVLICTFELFGQVFEALNCGGDVPRSHATSFSVDCEDQAEVDGYWDRMAADGGKPLQCGWIEDRFGYAWQIVPSALPRLLKQADPAAAARVMQAMMQMVKIDVATLEAASKG